jgi:hypothetical protein
MPQYWDSICQASHFFTETGFWTYYIWSRSGREQLTTAVYFSSLTLWQTTPTFLCIWMTSVGEDDVCVHSDNNLSLDGISSIGMQTLTHKVKWWAVNVLHSFNFCCCKQLKCIPMNLTKIRNCNHSACKYV